MNLLQECSKNIEKLEFKPSTKKQQLLRVDSNNESPAKLNSSKAAVCIVDLSKKDELDDNLPLRLPQPDKDDIQENEEDGDQIKNVPNMTG